MRITLLLLLVFSCSCSVLVPRQPAHHTCAAAMTQMARGLASARGDDRRTIAFLGLRETSGKQTPASRSLEEVLLSQLLREGVSVDTEVGVTAPGPDEEGPPWKAEALLPSGWREHSSPLLLSGQVRIDEPWAYVRAVLVETRTGAVLHADAGRVSSDDLQERGDGWARQRLSPDEAGEGAVLPEELELAMDLHVVVRRDEGGFARAIELPDGGALRQGDRLQIRFRPRVDCTVYAFIYGSEAQRQEVHASRLVYGGRWQYGPAEQRWVSVGKADRVYTLYLVAAPRLDDLGEMMEDMDHLVEQGQVHAFTGLDALDAVVSSYVDAQTEGSSPIRVLRGAEGVAEGDVVDFTYEDGTVLKSRAQVVTARRGLVWGVGYEVVPD